MALHACEGRRETADSITQIALGAAIGEATLGRKAGYRAALWGGICGTLPDLDVLVPFTDAVADFSYHRAATHSLFVLTALTPLVVWLIRKLHPQLSQYRTRWLLLVFLALTTHALLDALTVYGTQLLWPLGTPPVGWSTIFIIDPLYTLWLLIGIGAALTMSRHTPSGHRINSAGLILSSMYLLWSIGAKAHVDGVVRADLAQREIPYTRMLSLASPFNTLLWRVVVMQEDTYLVGYYSLLDEPPVLRYDSYPRNTTLLAGLDDHWPVARLRWFTKGFYAVVERDSYILIQDLRMGLEPDFVFQFRVARAANPHAIPISARRAPVQQRFERLADIWRRIRDPGVRITPMAARDGAG
ncbi:MAG: metal-dependent hydrolase [Gammaproteobacteria bacterium]|nr:metal-dependent hydrolase [Gammaproteobacteria bacterium]